MHASKAIKAKTVSPKNQALAIQKQLTVKCVSYALTKHQYARITKAIKASIVLPNN